MRELFAIIMLLSVTQLFAQIEISVDDSNMYSQDFLDELYSGKFYKETCKTVELKDGLLIMNGNDTVSFPVYPEIGDYQVYTAKRGELAVALKIKRINYTSVEYELEMVEFGKANHFKNGVASIGDYFFFGSESDSNNGEGYFIDEYYDNDGDCLCIIGIGEAFGSEIWGASVNSTCNGELDDLNTDEFPKLRIK